MANRSVSESISGLIRYAHRPSQGFLARTNAEVALTAGAARRSVILAGFPYTVNTCDRVEGVEVERGARGYVGALGGTWTRASAPRNER
jgi:hypothetical protein